MLVGVPGETSPDETRVALVPSDLPLLKKAGIQVLIRKGAGLRAGYPDEAYTKGGANLAESNEEVYAAADLVARVRSLGASADGREDIGRMKEGQVLVAFCDPLGEPAVLEEAARAKLRVFPMELVPRISRAQSMDALSSMATVAGYKAVLIAASALPKMFPMMMTAAGSIAPAKVFVMGAGVAGLQAIASARRLGALVQAYDVRPAVKEEIESLGGRFVEIEVKAEDSADEQGYAKAQGEEFYKKQRELLAKVVTESDIVITTALIPGKPAPMLVPEEAVKGMHPGSVIIDLAAERGGNCAFTKADETIEVGGVTIMGPTNLPATVPFHASQMYSRNVTNLLVHLVKDGELKLDLEDEVTGGFLATHDGAVRHPRVLAALEAGSQESK